jgi:hypothetical protein
MYWQRVKNLVELIPHDCQDDDLDQARRRKELKAEERLVDRIRLISHIKTKACCCVVLPCLATIAPIAMRLLLLNLHGLSSAASPGGQTFHDKKSIFVFLAHMYAFRSKGRKRDEWPCFLSFSLRCICLPSSFSATVATQASKCMHMLTRRCFARVLLFPPSLPGSYLI